MHARILVVDDEHGFERLINIKFRKQIQEGKYDFSFALDGSEAKKLLKNQELSIADIAYSIGFNNPNWFTRAFSNFYGVSPTKYREQELK